MNTMGCSFLFLASAMLLVGLIPYLTWTNLVIALPLAVLGAISAFAAARKPHAQSADKAALWFSLALILMIGTRIAFS